MGIFSPTGVITPQFGTRDIGKDIKLPEDTRTEKKKCEDKGGYWDERTQTCILVKEKDKPQPTDEFQGDTGFTKQPNKVFTDVKGVPGGVQLADGRIFLGLDEKDIERVLKVEQSKQQTLTSQLLAGQEQEQIQKQQQREGQQLAGGVGQFQQLGVSPTGLDVGEAATTGVIGSIPSALRLAVTGAGVGLVGGATVGALGGPIGAGAGAAIGAVAGFVGGISSGMISNFKSQRSDTTTSQQRILDEGKQTMKDWATLAKNDPANKAYYLGQYNQQSAQIDQAYRQMKLDTSRDVAKFETALPNLAEFEAFYSSGGERDTLDIEMRNSLVAAAPEGYDMLELAYRSVNNEQKSK